MERDKDDVVEWSPPASAHSQLVFSSLTEVLAAMGGGGSLVEVQVGDDFLAKLERAIRLGDLKRANLTLVKKTPMSSSERACLRDHVICELPVLHYLAGWQSVDPKFHQELETLIGFYIESGYEIDKPCSSYAVQKSGTVVSGFTALLAAVEQTNWMMLELLIKFGADVNVRDGRGLSACHWAVIVGELKTLKMLLHHGAVLSATEAELKGENDIHPILHTAIDLGRSNIVFHLVTNKLVDLNQVAVYRYRRHELSRQANVIPQYNCVDDNGMIVAVELTPLARAVRERQSWILELLLNSGALVNGFRELHYCIEKGDTEVANMLIHRFSDEELCTDKIGSRWALHCLPRQAFLDERQIEFTKQLISEYVNAGWDINATSSLAVKFATFEIQNSRTTVCWSKYSLLHLACFYESRPIVKWFVAKPGINLNLRTGVGCSLTPLQVSILNEDWGTAMDLINSGSDINVEGCLGLPVREHIRIRRDNNENWDPSLGFSSVELLLLQPGANNNSVPILDMMLEKGVVWNGANELLAAIEGRNPLMIARLLLRFSDFLTAEEFSTFTSVAVVDTDHSIPAFIYLLCLIIVRNDVVKEVDFEILADLLDVFVAQEGYDCNKVYEVAGLSTLIFVILDVEVVFRTNNLLLQRLLKVDHVQLNVRNADGLTPVEYVISLWNEHCISDRCRCWRSKDRATYCCKTVKLLIQHGANVQGLMISKDLTHYHHGYKEMFQMLYFAGAKFDADFFTPDAACHAGHLRTAAFPGEIEQLRQWIEEATTKSRLNLKWKARICTRGLLHRVGALQALETLPRKLRTDVLCETISV